MWFVWEKSLGKFFCFKCEDLPRNEITQKEITFPFKYKLTEEEFKLSLNALKEKYPPPTLEE